MTHVPARPLTPGLPARSHPLPHPPSITRAFAKRQLLTHPLTYPLPRPVHARSLVRVRLPTLIHPRALNPLPPRSLTAQRAHARCAIAPLAHPRPSLPPSPFAVALTLPPPLRLHALCRHSSSPRPCPLLSPSSSPSLFSDGAAACTQARLHTQTSHSVCVYALARTPSSCARTSAVVPEGTPVTGIPAGTKVMTRAFTRTRGRGPGKKCRVRVRVWALAPGGIPVLFPRCDKRVEDVGA